MDEKQLLCKQFVEKGHNVCILGQAGSGKTHTIKHIISVLPKNVRLQLTCYTGISALQYKGLRPTTLHKFAGLEDGRHTKEELLHLLKTDERYSSTKYHIKETDLLFIDEISMLSKQNFECVEYICRNLKDVIQIFGGMQVVLSGDFFQLPPVKDELHGDSGDYCFNATFFKHFFPHIVLLCTVHRQDEPVLIKAVNELEHGCPSEHTHIFIRSLSRPLNNINDSNIVRLQ